MPNGSTGAQGPALTVESLGRAPELPAEALDAPAREVFDAFRSFRDTIPGPFRAWLRHGEFAARMKSVSDKVIRDGLLTAREREIAILMTARHLDAAFIRAAHEKIGARAGLSEAVMTAIHEGRTPDLDTDREQALHAAAAAMLTARPAPQDVYDEALATLGIEALCELSGLMGFYSSCAFILTFHDAQAG
ncbi:carboxymuconolactone decarboxylase family protein [Oceanicola sp. 22II-s10i]|uniref:carboxymuconolactone decarboxylase family protein n=1 Tax=Oceanicola sp. 22II-s10i TaxID=1317116 RepID=UPI000B521D0C|nr:carboxymuconolactone decarboxylase family protein [Oceanicola sp. 22II-s10i]